jgi:peptidoglycan/LPS O-acetylase OafA/YrhL
MRGLAALYVVFHHPRAGLAIGLLPHFVLPADANLDWACPWYTAALELRAILGIPVAIGLAFAFHLLFERPFLAKKNESASIKRSLAQQGSPSVGSS